MMNLWTWISAVCATWVLLCPAGIAPATATASLARSEAAAVPRRSIARPVTATPRPRVPLVVRRGAWTLDLPRADRIQFLRSVARLRSFPRGLLTSIEPRTSVRVMDVTSCGTRRSCAIGTITDVGAVRTSAYELEFFRGNLEDTSASQFLVAHELGHLVEYEGLSVEGQAAFARAFEASPAWRSCFPYEGACVGPAEVFADQFAMYALGEPSSLTAYDVPRLVGDATFERLLRQHYAPHA